MATHKINTPNKPERKDLPAFWWITTATINAAIAIPHQGRNKPLINYSMAVNSMATKNFMLMYLILGCYS